MSARPVLKLSNIVKTYPGVRALDSVSLEVVEGEVHALLGENGAGKSTLIGIAAGSVRPDSGTVEIGQAVLPVGEPATAQRLGLSVVYQHPATLKDLTVAENLIYSIPGELRQTQLNPNDWVDDKLAAVGATFSRDARVGELSAAERQLVELAKALAVRPKVLILDEPTEALNSAEIEVLFEKIEAIRKEGTAVVYISHRLPEVQRIADRISVLRDGKMQGCFPASGVTEKEILSLIIGRTFEAAFPDKPGFDTDADPILTVSKLRGGKLRGVSLDVKPGEVVGLAGVEGNGQADFIRAIAGLQKVSGDVSVNGGKVSGSDPAAAQDAGIIYLPGDRHNEGAFMGLSVEQNGSMLVLDRMASMGVLSPREERSHSQGFIRDLRVKTDSPDTQIGSLSGGNQQKVMYARSIAAKPKVFLADQPTSGVDAGARVELYNLLRQVSGEGAGVVVLSSDAIELVGLCDRVVIFSRGSIVTELTGDDITEKNITGAAVNAAETTHETETEGGFGRWRRFASGDIFPILVLAAIILALAMYTAGMNDRFLSGRSINGMLFLASALGFIAMGQLCVMLTGGIDLSVGPLAGFVVVILSFFAGDGASFAQFGVGMAIALLAAGCVGLANGLLIRKLKFSPLITTLAMFIALQGFSLLLRSVPDGFFDRQIIRTMTTAIGPVPVIFIITVIAALALEYALRNTLFGLELRAIGSDEDSARKLGASADRTVILGYVACSVLTGIGGIFLSAQIGVGDPTVGQNYTLQSIAAVVLGGASIFGGRGSFLSVIAGVLLIQEITSISAFLRLGTAWQYWLPGLLTLASAAIYARARGSASRSALGY